MKKPLFLLSNDDGYYAEGLSMLVNSMREMADVVIVAPDQNCSGVSHKISLSTPLRLREVAKDSYALNGSPADCIHIALHVILKGQKPDCVISGINHGINLGEDTAYSGTVAAAYEGQVHGIPSIAVSTDRTNINAFHFRNAALAARMFAKKLLNHEVPSDAMWNLNVPPSTCKGIKFTRLDNRSFQSSIIERKDPRGNPYYWIGPYHPVYEATEGTDYEAFQSGYISATPIKVEMTHNQILNRMTEAVESNLFEAFQNESK